jgi:hypothetical protein
MQREDCGSKCGRELATSLAATTWHCLEQAGFALTPQQKSRASDFDPAPRQRLRCKRCGHSITEAEQRILVEGAHVHRRRNPAGIQFEFGCFRLAAGCRSEGEATVQHTWFAGYAWAVALCAQCGEHLGWHYDGGVSFYGLILERLVAEQ